MKIKLDYNDRCTPDRSVNALPIGYKNKPVNLANDQLNAQFLFYNKFIIFLYMFRALLCSSSGGQIVLYSIWYHHTL